MRKVEKERLKNKKKKNELEAKQSEIRELEQFYANGTIDNLPEIIEQKKEKLTTELIKFQNDHKEPYKWDEEGNPTAFKIVCSPIVVQQNFFKSLISIHSSIPEYNAEKLSIVYDYYCYLISEVNDKIGKFPCSINSFCKFAGITVSQLRTIKNYSYDESLRIIAEKIYDEIGDTNITMAQMGIVNEKSTIFKLKTQNEIVEAAQPNVNINISKKIDEEEANEILNRIGKYSNLIKKKGGK